MKPASAICFLLGRSDLILLQLQAVPDLAVNACSKIALRLRNLVLEVAVIDVLDHAAESNRDVLSFRFGPIAIIGFVTLRDSGLSSEQTL